MVSIVEIPVEIISSGYTRAYGLIGDPLISRCSSAKTFGPLSIGLPEPSKIRPSMSSDTGIFRFWPVNSTVVLRVSTPVVPSKTCITGTLSRSDHNSSFQETNLHDSLTPSNLQHLTSTLRTIGEGEVDDL